MADFSADYHEQLLCCLQEEHSVKMKSLRRDAELREREHEARMDLYRSIKSRLETSGEAGHGDCQELQPFTSVLRYM